MMVFTIWNLICSSQKEKKVILISCMILQVLKAHNGLLLHLSIWIIMVILLKEKERFSLMEQLLIKMFLFLTNGCILGLIFPLTMIWHIFIIRQKQHIRKSSCYSIGNGHTILMAIVVVNNLML